MFIIFLYVSGRYVFVFLWIYFFLVIRVFFFLLMVFFFVRRRMVWFGRIIVVRIVFLMIIFFCGMYVFGFLNSYLFLVIRFFLELFLKFSIVFNFRVELVGMIFSGVIICFRIFLGYRGNGFWERRIFRLVWLSLDWLFLLNNIFFFLFFTIGFLMM